MCSLFLVSCRSVCVCRQETVFRKITTTVLDYTGSPCRPLLQDRLHQFSSSALKFGSIIYGCSTKRSFVSKAPDLLEVGAARRVFRHPVRMKPDLNDSSQQLPFFFQFANSSPGMPHQVLTAVALEQVLHHIQKQAPRALVAEQLGRHSFTAMSRAPSMRRAEAWGLASAAHVVIPAVLPSFTLLTCAWRQDRNQLVFQSVLDRDVSCIFSRKLPYRHSSFWSLP